MSPYSTRLIVRALMAGGHNVLRSGHIARRELSSLFFSPVAYLVAAIFAFGATCLFLRDFAPGAPASMRATFVGVAWLLILLSPAISMRLFAEELRTGTYELLMTSPISATQTVLGKWGGALAFLIVLLLPLVVLAGVLAVTSRPDYGPILTGLLGLILIGGFYLAIGTFASATTQNQIIAFILSGFIICFLTIGMFLMPQGGSGIGIRPNWYLLLGFPLAFAVVFALFRILGRPRTRGLGIVFLVLVPVAIIGLNLLLVLLPPMGPSHDVTLNWNRIRPVLNYMNAIPQFENFAKGVIDTSSIVYFGSGIAFFLFLAVLVLESRRWR